MKMMVWGRGLPRFTANLYRESIKTLPDLVSGMGLLDSILGDSQSDTEDVDEEEEEETEQTPKERGYREVEKTRERVLRRYKVNAAGDEIEYNFIDRKENHVEFFEAEVFVRSGMYWPKLETSKSLVAVVPWENIDGTLQPEEIDATTYKVDYTIEEKWLSHTGKWSAERMLECGDLYTEDDE